MGVSRSLTAVAAAGSAGLLVAALGLQFVGGLSPCVLCIWQRWPHAAAILLGGAGWFRPVPALALSGAAAALASAAVAAFHTGVEQGWWEGLAACTAGPDLTSLTPEQALAAMMHTAPGGCGTVAWSFAGLSMASWNMAISLGLACLWIAALRKRAA